MDAYHRRRLVSWIAYHVNKGRTWEEICARNKARRNRHPQEEMDVCREEGHQAVATADALRDEIARRRAIRQTAAAKGLPPPVFPPVRLCDLPGCKFPTDG